MQEAHARLAGEAGELGLLGTRRGYQPKTFGFPSNGIGVPRLSG